MKGTIDIHEDDVLAPTPTKAIARFGPSAPVLPRTQIVMAAPPQERPMFADSLLEFGQHRRRKAMATTTAFIVNGLILSFVLALPLMFTEELPRAQLLTLLIAPPPPPPPPPPAAGEQMQKIVRQIQTDMLSTGELRTPTKIPQKIQMIKEDEAPPPIAVGGGVVGGVPGGIPGGQLGGVIGGIISAASNLSAVPKFAPILSAPQRVRISQGVTKGLLLQRIEPPYPTLARQARVQGQVVLKAIINRNGEIQDLELISGHPMLVPAAIAAVKQWRYKPYLLNGQPVEVETTITVIFALST